MKGDLHIFQPFVVEPWGASILIILAGVAWQVCLGITEGVCPLAAPPQCRRCTEEHWQTIIIEDGETKQMIQSEFIALGEGGHFHLHQPTEEGAALGLVASVRIVLVVKVVQTLFFLYWLAK
jgi:hypothetical protein